MDDLEIVTAVMPSIDECPVLTRLRAFVVDQGTSPVLEHVFRLRNGNPADLGRYVTSEVSESGSDSASEPAAGDVDSDAIRLRIKEWIAEGVNPATNPIWTTTGFVQDAAHGVLRARIPPAVTEHPGIYELSWGVSDRAGRLVGANQAIMSVERSLFPADFKTLYLSGGPVTIGEIRLSLLDEVASNLLLDDVEFSDAQILQAIAEPVRQWNETTPPIGTFTTRTFPFRGAWLSAIAGRLHVAAANHYRRNLLQAQAGGITVPDKAKEREYMAEGQRLLDQYTAWLRDKKLEINMRLVAGSSRSIYSTLSGW